MYRKICSITQLLLGYTRALPFSTQSKQESYLKQTLPNDPALLFKHHQILHDQSQLVIHWEKDSVPNNFHALWLRHQCHCNACTHLTSGQRFIDPRELCAPVGIHKVKIIEDRIELEWRNADGEQHQGFLPLKWLHLNRSSYQKDSQEPLRLCEMEYEYIMSSEQSFYEYLRTLNQHGLLKVTKAPKGSVLKIADAVSNRYDSIWGREFDYGLKIDPNTLAFSNKSLYFHIDLPYMQNKPGIAYLHCLRCDDCVEGGVLTVKDGFRIAETFRKEFPGHFKTLSTVLVKHNYVSLQHEACYMRESTHFVVDKGGELREVNWAPNIQLSISDTSDGDRIQEYTNAYHKFNEFIQEYSEKVDIKYKGGDIAVFHNLRMLHMRNALNLNGGVRHIHGCYSPIDEYRSKIRYLSLKLGKPLPNKIW